jgi:hypothetical protein
MVFFIVTAVKISNINEFGLQILFSITYNASKASETTALAPRCFLIDGFEGESKWS